MTLRLGLYNLDFYRKALVATCQRTESWIWRHSWSRY